MSRRRIGVSGHKIEKICPKNAANWFEDICQGVEVTFVTPSSACGEHAACIDSPIAPPIELLKRQKRLLARGALQSRSYAENQVIRQTGGTLPR